MRRSAPITKDERPASYRHRCAILAGKQGARAMEATSLWVAITFLPPDRRRRDLDNCLASFKAGIDGLADVLGVDDSKWKLEIAMSSDIGGFVRVEVMPCHV